jgi:hypothetical protein
MKKLLTILCILLVQNVSAQSDTIPLQWYKIYDPAKDTCVSRAEYDRNQALYQSVCNILQYISTDGKVTDKKAFAAAVKFYLEFLKQNPQP